MAMTYLEKMKQNQSQQAPQGLRGVSENTQTQMAKYQNGYQPTEQAQQAQQNLQTVQQQKPQSYSSKWSGALDNILQQINNPGEFKYSLDNDGLFQSYKDLYTQKAKQGAMDTMGMAAGLTGGYGNSWAQSAGAQAYQQNLLPLFDKSLEFAKMAQDRHNADRADQYNRLSALQGMEESEYGRYRDTVSDYNAELERAREDARYADEMGYQQYADMLKYWQNQAAAENADYQTGEEMAYRYNTLDEEARQADQNEAFRNKQLDWQMDTDARDYAENVRQYNTNLAENQRQFDTNTAENARQFDTQMAEQIRSTNADEDYRNRQLAWQQDVDARDYAESVRQYDTNMAENARQFDTSMLQNAQQFAESNKLDWANLEEKQRQYDSSLSEEQRQYNQDYAMKLCSAILANGQIPSNELLVMAGLSYEDAQKLIAQETGGPGGPGPDSKNEIAQSLAAGGVSGNGLLGTNYEQLAKEAAAIAGTYEEGSADRQKYMEDAKLLSEASKAKDTMLSTKQNQGNTNTAQEAEYLKMLEQQRQREKGYKTTSKK